jgi:FkbM family methyltransferase
MKYSQNNEEQHILEYWSGQTGRLLDIGAYDGKTFSNTKALIDRGWSGVMVEASPRCFASLMETYRGNPKVDLLQALVGYGTGVVKFHDSMGACATTDQECFDRWSPHQKDFQTINLPVLDVGLLFDRFGFDFDFINIDCEGMDWGILQRIPLAKMKTRMVCVEYGKHGSQIQQFMESLGPWKAIHANMENAIFAL